MAKRELSNTLMNLKFMQRATHGKEITNKEDEAMPSGHLCSSGIVKKCVVIMEGDPHPGAIAGRMSFQSFNPSLDKLKEEEAAHLHPQPSNLCDMTFSHENSNLCSRENGSCNGAEDKGMVEPKGGEKGDHKRKQAEPLLLTKNKKKSPTTAQQGKYASPSSSSRRNSYMGKQNWEKGSWNVLQPRAQ